ncbi:MAG: LysR family transcriptional regulator [Planctomycetes bacterium]|nr:LysR family transcriptional regulator [Planctomycetota bacterium]
MSHVLLARLRPRLKVWIEVGGRPVFGDGKRRWLELIDRTGSLRATAAALGMSYRGLWGRLRGMEDGLGVRLVHRRTGGTGGGGVGLTGEARALVALYDRFRRGLDPLVLARFRSALAEFEKKRPRSPLSRRAARSRGAHDRA